MSSVVTASTTVQRAAQAAASSQHALVNLVRLVGALDKNEPSTPDEQGDWAASANLKKEVETIQYARMLLDSLRNANEGTSSSSSTLTELDSKLRSIEARYRDLSFAATAPEVRPILPMTTSFSAQHRSSSTSSTTVPNGMKPEEIARSPELERSSSISLSRTVLRQRHLNVDEYLARRSSEQIKGDEADLLPLKLVKAVSQTNEPGARDRLLGGPRAGIGSAQLHDELGGQLADMSHRLKLNALHFANSLEDEKAMLDTSTEVLEKNLSTTRSSKKNLSAVSSKGKGTTCMTLGIIVLVLIIFVWTYMLIRFT